MMKPLTPKAKMFFAVSMKLSPLLTLEPAGEKSMVSAPSLRAAKPKLTRVRVEDSKNRFAITLPLRKECFFSGLRLASTKNSEALKMVSNSAIDSSSMPRRCFFVQGPQSIGVSEEDILWILIYLVSVG